MSKIKLRKITVLNETYLWKREHHHLIDFEHSECVEKVTIYLEGYKNSPLIVSFREEDNLKDVKEKWCMDSVIWLSKPRKDGKPQTNTIIINLNRPAVIATLISYFTQNEWAPKKRKTPYIIKNALKYLEMIEFPKGIN